MTPLQKYEALLATNEIKVDAQQHMLVRELNDIFLAVLKRYKRSPFNIFKSKKSINGLYMWGSVGVGKTFLLDLFFECATFPKMRMHFFAFMRYIHQALQEKQGQKNPLEIIAKELAKKTTVLCFDEFFVSDIADAMLLGELFKTLFDAGIVLITTSNIAPDGLYKNGLQRERFLPAIELIKQHTQVIHLTTKTDYRLQHDKPAKAYFYPLNEDTQSQMDRSYDYYTNGLSKKTDKISINNHDISIVKVNQGILWCEFSELCEADRSQDDYLELAKNYHTILISNTHPIPANNRKTILRFIHLIDVFYDEHVRLIISADTEPTKLYSTGPYEFEFQRTVSRLIEMQSKDYFDRDEHIMI